MNVNNAMAAVYHATAQHLTSVLLVISKRTKYLNYTPMMQSSDLVNVWKIHTSSLITQRVKIMSALKKFVCLVIHLAVHAGVANVNHVLLALKILP